MNFGKVIEELKKGNKVSRAGWNGKNMWLALQPALYLEADKVNERTKKNIGNDTDLDCQPYVAMWNAAGQWQPGWLPSQQDLLAEDWGIVE